MERTFNDEILGLVLVVGVGIRIYLLPKIWNVNFRNSLRYKFLILEKL